MTMFFSFELRELIALPLSRVYIENNRLDFLIRSFLKKVRKTFSSFFLISSSLENARVLNNQRFSKCEFKTGKLSSLYRTVSWIFFFVEKAN